MQYAVTDVCPAGAQTVATPDRTVALSAFAMKRADPTVLYVQVVANGKVVKQFVRHSIDMPNLELDA